MLCFPDFGAASLDFSSISWSDLLWAAPSWEVQLVLVVSHAALWHTIPVWLLPPRVRSNSRTNGEHEQPWRIPPRRRDNVHGMLAQHLFGAMLCVPSLLAASPSRVASALACHGALAEVGWEIQDAIIRARGLFAEGQDGLCRSRTRAVAVLLHHVAAQCLVLPLNVHYHDCKIYHESIFVLQGVAVAAFLCQNAAFQCQVDQGGHLLQRSGAAVAASAILVFWSRSIHSSYLWCAMLAAIHADEQGLLFSIGVVPIFATVVLNVLMVADCCEQFAKSTWPASPQEELKVVHHEAGMRPMLLGKLHLGATVFDEKQGGML